MPQSDCVDIHDSHSQASSPQDQQRLFRDDVLRGLSRTEGKMLDCKYLYDEEGSRLFDQICELPEYYPTRTESKIIADNADAICDRIGANAILVEYGSGSSTKTRQLLDHLDDQRAYLPVDISDDHLMSTAEQLRSDYPDLDIRPIVADFTSEFDLPEEFESEPVSVYFPGSTIGNLAREQAVELLGGIAAKCHRDGGLLIGFDLDKDPPTLIAAYDDASGVTAEFNLNLLRRINRELDANFQIDNFQHEAIYNPEHTRIEIYIRSQCDQVVTIAGQEIHFSQGERILTEYSHKYSTEKFVSLAGRAGFQCDEYWTDAKNRFAVMFLSLA